ncbi:MAG: 2-oxoacid:acceptor oxidoreductase family protein [Armatimonadetes bacterium]|nr:2-oxoacid:acceptor oxidoreductase family protein [Armatimonadota bacterium]MDW8027706.1 2-oxoacid:acceptor oxidoreductase family protein [Armatimonadota bacterium]
MSAVAQRNLIEIRWHARAGQGAKTAANILAQAALREGKYAQSFPEFGPERRGAPMQAFNRLSDEPFYMHSGITEPDIVIVVDPRLMETIPVTDGLKPNGWVIVNTHFSPEEAQVRWELKPFKVATVDASAIARETLKQDIPNVPLLGAFAKVTGLVSLETLQSDTVHRLEKRFRDRPQVIEANLKALERGFNEVSWVDAQVFEPILAEPSQIAFKSWTELQEGGIIPEPSTSLLYRTGSWRLERPVFDPQKCVQCLMCWLVCPDSAIVLESGKVVGIDYDHCKGCGLCSLQCPPKAKALTMVLEAEFDKK